MRSYEDRGVSPHKPDVRAALAHTGLGLFPGSFAKAVPDVFTGSLDHCLVFHSDGAGTKSVVAYLHYRRHHDPSIFNGIAQDASVMNLDDLLCVGATGPFLLSNTIGRNAKLVPGEIIAALIQGYEDFIDRLRQHNVDVILCGGETADLGDIVRTLVVDASIATRMERAAFIDCNNVKPGHAIVGLASAGQATYEDAPNSGIGANGFTAARHELLRSTFRKDFPETFAPEIEPLAYIGNYDLDDPLPDSTLTIGQALLSPTRTYAPVLMQAFARFRPHISGLFHNTGGGQTKCLGFGVNVHYEKFDLFDPPPIFRFIQSAAGLSLREMLRTFNMGHRLEVVCDEGVAPEIVALSQSFGVDAKIVGRVLPSSSGCRLTIAMKSETVQFHDSEPT